MAQFDEQYTQDLTQRIIIRQCGNIVFNGDNLSNVIRVSLYNGTTPATLSGTVVGAVICSDGSTVPVDNGTISGNTVTLTLTQACFAIAGQIGVGIQIVSGTTKTTIFKGIYNVERLTTENVVDPSGRITLEVSDLIAAIDEATEAIPADYSELMAQVSKMTEDAHERTAEVPNADTWSRGALNPATGGAADNTDTTRIRTAWSTEFPIGVKPAEGYKVAVYVRLNNVYQGIIQADGTLAKTEYFATNAVWLDRIAEGAEVRYQFAKTDNSNIALAAGANLLFCTFTDTTLSQAGKIADAKAVGDLHAINAEVLNLHKPQNDLVGYYLPPPPQETVYPVASEYSNISDYIPVRGGEILAGHGFRRYWWYTDNTGTTISTTSSGNLGDQQLIDAVSEARAIVVPDSAKYMRFSYRARTGEGIDADTNTYLFHMPFGAYFPTGGKKYVALGSSSVAGTYSVIGNPISIDTVPRFSFVQWIARINGYSLVNLGVGGMGWRNKSKASGGGRNAAETIDYYYQPEADPPVNEFADADIITLYFGTNDWKGQWGASDTDAGDGWTLGDMTSPAATNGTVIGAMKYTLEKLIEAAPQAQIIVVLPGNFKKLGNTKSGDESNPEIDVVEVTTPTGTQQISYAKLENRYALGTHNVKGDTLADYHAAIKACAEYYGVRFVNAGEICAGNLLNIDHMLGDGIHPTIAFYKQMGYSLAPFIK